MPPYVFTLGRRTITAGDGAAVISAPRAPVTLTVGQRLTVAILRDAAGGLNPRARLRGRSKTVPSSMCR